jgi:hypothetical protein
MRRKLLVFAVAAGIAGIASWAPRAEASDYCESICYFASSGPGTPCTCSAGTDRPGRTATCGTWEGTGTRGCFLS